MASTTNMAGTTATMLAQPEVNAATMKYHKQATVEEQQEAEIVKPKTMVVRLFSAVELIESIIVKRQVVTDVARDYTVMDINMPHVDHICMEA